MKIPFGVNEVQCRCSKTCVKRPLKIDKTKILITIGSLMKVESIAELGAFCNTFDLHLAIIGLENQILVFLRVAVLYRFYMYFILSFNFS